MSTRAPLPIARPLAARLLAVLLLLWGMLSPATAAAAHAPGQAYVFLRIHDDSLVVRLELNRIHLDSALGLGWSGPTRLTREQVQVRLAAIRRYAEANLALAGDDGRRLTAAYQQLGIRVTESGEFVMLDYLVRTAPPRRLRVTYTPFFDLDPSHRNLLVVEHDWKAATFNNESNVSLIFSPDTPTQTLDLTTSSLWRGFVALVRLGVWHIWMGFDHILFLFALMLPSVLQRHEGRWQPAPGFRSALVKIVKIVTCFTIAHTITLSLAALDVVHLPSRLVEAVIAASITAAALHNLWPLARVNEPLIAFVFGLFHGFGFATVLGEIGLGRDHMALSLLGFNLGVEIGQVAVILAVFPALFLLRRLRMYRWMLRLGSTALVAIGLLWVAERTLDFNVPLATIARSAFAWLGGDVRRA